MSQVGLELPILLPHLKCWGYEFHVKSRQLAVQLYTSSSTAQSQLNSGGAAQRKKADQAAGMQTRAPVTETSGSQ